MVCLGNICRSPLAEGILKSKLGEDYFVDSAGTINYHEGSGPDARSIKVGLQNGVDISQQKSRIIKVSDLDNFDLIFCMDRHNYKDVLAIAGDDPKPKIRLILQNGEDVPDPYFGGEGGFAHVYSLLDAACEIIAEKIRNNTL